MLIRYQCYGCHSICTASRFFPTGVRLWVSNRLGGDIAWTANKLTQRIFHTIRCHVYQQNHERRRRKKRILVIMTLVLPSNYYTCWELDFPGHPCTSTCQWGVFCSCIHLLISLLCSHYFESKFSCLPSIFASSDEEVSEQEAGQGFRCWQESTHHT